MPLLSRRRSLLDLSKRDAHSDSETTPTKTKPSRANLHPNDHVTSLRPTSAHGQSSSRLSHELRPEDLSDASPDTSGVAQRAKRFSMVKLRNFSESHLSVKAKEADSDDLTPPVPAVVEPAVPSIVRTAPTMDDQIMQGHEEEGEGRASTHMSRSVRHSMFMRSLSKSRDRRTEDKTKATDRKKEKPHSSLRWRRTNKSSGLEELLSVVHDSHNASSAPPSYGDESHSDVALQVPDPRYSDSSRSDCSNNSSSEQIYGQTTTTRTVSTYTTFFKLSRRNKNRDSLFPLPVTIPPPTEKPGSRSGPTTPRASTSAISSQESGLETPPTVLQRRRTESSPTHRSGSRPVTSPQAAPPKASLLFHEPTPALLREGSTRSHASSSSSPLQPPMRLGLRGRASTNSSDRHSHDPGTPPQYPGSVRNSTSTAGRPSFGGLLNLTRFRQGSEPHSPRHGSPGTRSKSNSFAISREALVIPEREEGDTPGKYLERLEAAVARSVIAGILSKSSDPFAQAVLRSYTRRFMFFGEPIDMSLRKFLLEAELPKETQQVDRVIQAFADRYHECNPGIFVAPDQAYIIAFSLMMLHTDAFNKNNKRKMQKHDYIKNTSGQYVSDDILACFYDNICYTPFVHYEEEVDINGERVLPFKPKKSKFKGSVTDSAGKKPSGPVDPYNLLVENKLDTLRPSLRDSITLDDPYNYRGSESDFDPAYLQRAFTHTGVLQIISARSRPAAYEGQLGHTNEASTPTETQQGIVDLKITKVGTLWRKAAKKKKARSPWQEWGAVLTGSQLYLFRNTHWAKGLAHQFNSQQKLGHPRIPVIFKPPLQEFKPDALIKTDNAVALVDATYTRHKHAFTFFRTGGQEEVFLAENESEMNDWLALINYAAAFRAAGVRIRGMVGGSEEESKPTHPQRFGSSASTQSSPKSNHDEDSTVSRVVMSPQLQRQVMAARRQIMVSKIAESETEIAATVKRLDEIMRNARHLLILAPIAPRTRDDVIHAAARADATIKWVRRDIWRLKCHRDILAMDVQLDGLTAAEIEKLAEQRMTVIQENSKKEQSSLVARMGSKVGVMRSPPQSPASPTRSARPSTTSSKETFLAKDAFRVSAEPPTPQNEVDAYQIPPLQLDLQHRGSITSAMLSVSSYSRPSLSQASSIASMQPATRLDSNALSDVTSIRSDQALSTPIRGDSEAERLARASTATPETLLATSRTKSTEESSVNATPESARRKGARRSLQRTLREAHGSTHRHRRAKDSESTIRSGAIESDELAEGTPGLQRENGRFILHGKQASVVQLDWSSDQMQQRRETMKSDAPRQSFENNRNSMASRTSPHPLSTEAWSPLVREYHHGDQDSDHEEGSSKSAHSLGLRSDAEAAEAFTGAEVDDDDSSEDEMTFFFDANEESDQDQEYRRRTVIGPSQVFPSQRSDGENGSESDGFSLISADSAVNSQGQSGSDPHGAESRK